MEMIRKDVVGMKIRHVSKQSIYCLRIEPSLSVYKILYNMEYTTFFDIPFDISSLTSS